jgi:hypothetical protein
MLVTFHRFDPSVELPRQRIDLYRGIVKLQLEDHPKARLIRMYLSFEQSQRILQTLALAMVKKKAFKVSRSDLLTALQPLPIWQQESVESADWLQQIVDVSELLVEREPGEYEFPHLSFQGFFAATRLATPQDKPGIQKSAELILNHWNQAVWRETVLLYTAQLNPKLLDQVLRKACDLGREATDLANLCLQEYRRPEKLSPELVTLLQTLKAKVKDSKYHPLEQLLKAQQWKQADKETYRLMITTVGKEEGQWFTQEELLNFDCETLLTIDGLWVKYSNGHFGFSVQKQIYVECGAKLDGNYPGDDIWEKFGDRVGWRKKDGSWSLSYAELGSIMISSPQGILPWGGGWVGWVVGGVSSRIQTCRL